MEHQHDIETSDEYVKRQFRELLGQVQPAPRKPRRIIDWLRTHLPKREIA